MQIALQSLLVLGGLGLALIASDKAVAYTRALAVARRAPAFIVGVALVSGGTDLPEIANSIAAHLQGAGDIDVGDSVGSALTQYTLVLGLFPAIVAVIAIDRRQIGSISALCVLGLGITVGFVADGCLTRWEGRRPRSRMGGIHVAAREVPAGACARRSSGGAVSLGAPVGTSAPEIVVDMTALVRGVPAIALGDALGSSLTDSRPSIGIGPIVAPAAVTPRLTIAGSLYSILAIAVVGTVLGVRRRHDRTDAVVLLVLDGLAYAVPLGAE